MRRISPSIIISAIAVVIACAGSATAASLITGSQIKNGTVTGKDIRNRSITHADLKRGAVSVAKISQATVSELQATVATTKVSRSEPIVAKTNVPGGDYSPKSITVMCPDGQVALGGGGAYTSRPDQAQIGTNRPVMDEAGTARGWEVGGRPSVFDGSETLEAYVICSP